MSTPRVIILMGVSGAGKTTIGRLLASRHGWTFFDADDFHPPANIAKMSQGIPLDGDDRLPWLEHLRREVIDAHRDGNPVILACSALKASYREILGLSQPGIATVFLEGDSATLAERISARSGHYMKPDMLASQLEALKPPSPSDALYVPITLPPEEICERIEDSWRAVP